MMNCQNCGETIEENIDICPSCGSFLYDDAAVIYNKYLKTQHFFRTMRFYYNQYQEALATNKAYAKECLVYMCSHNDAAKMLDLYSFNTWKLIDRWICRLRKEVIK